MNGPRLKILYLTNAFPPGVGGRFRSLNPAGHAQETRMAQALSRRAAVSTVGLLAREVFGKLEPRDDSIGLEHELLLWGRRPELWHRLRELWRLRRFYLREFYEGPPDVVLVKNFTPVYNYFVRWLRRQHPRPKIVLMLWDSPTLGQRIPLARRLRFALKPMVTLDDAKAILWYDACVAGSRETRRFFEPRGVPWMWMPGAYNFYYEPPAPSPVQNGPIHFGYFGVLSPVTVNPLVRTFLNAGLPGSLHICGYGDLSSQLKELAAWHPNFHFDGVLNKQADCAAWAQRVDVLVNPRPPLTGLENTFPSKVFEYAMAGKAILTSRTGGVDAVLKDEGIYLESQNFEDSLRQKLMEVSAMDRLELQGRGKTIRNRLLDEFNWDEQARRMEEFLAGIVAPRDR